MAPGIREALAFPGPKQRLVLQLEEGLTFELKEIED
jgi:hypothetical protein